MMHESLPQTLRVLRARRGWTLVEAARQAGVGRDTLSDLERGRQHPSVPTLAKIAKGYGVPVEELLVEEGELAAPLAEASETEPAESEAPIFDVVQGLALRQAEREVQARNRLSASGQSQSVDMRPDNDALVYLLGRRRGEVEEAYVDLMKLHVYQEAKINELVRENMRLSEELAQSRERPRARQE